MITGQNPGEYLWTASRAGTASTSASASASHPRLYEHRGELDTTHARVRQRPVAHPRKRTGLETGIDRGCVHSLALSDGSFIDLPKTGWRNR